MSHTQVVPPTLVEGAAIALLGESPGAKELQEGRGWCGPAGWLLASTLRDVGVDIDACVRINAAWEQPQGGKWPTRERDGATLMERYAAGVDEALAAVPTLRVVVAAGAVALQRMTGLTDITAWRGSTLRYEDEPMGPAMEWARVGHGGKGGGSELAIRWPRRWPQGVMVVPTLHPAGILRDPSRSDLFLLRRDLAKAAAIARGAWAPHEHELRCYPLPEEVMAARHGAQFMYVDTEFNPATQRIKWVGLTFDGRVVWGMPWEEPWTGMVAGLMGDATLAKGAHHCLADRRIIAAQGVAIRGRWYDTMIGMYCAHPGTEVGLSPTSRYYLDHVLHRKWMDKDDPVYNGYDVAYGYGSWVAQREEEQRRAVDGREERDVRMRLLDVVDVMERRGMLIDREEQRALREAQRARVVELTAVVQEVIGALWAPKVEAAHGERATVEAAYKAHIAAANVLCPMHKTGWKKPPRSVRAKRCTCPVLEEDGTYARVRTMEGVLKARRAQGRKRAAREGKDFNPKSRDHLAWFLYSSEGLRLPVQRHRKTRQVTTSAAAIEKLSHLVSVKRDPAKWRVVEAIKGVQEAEKAISTFIDVPVDEWGWAHPPYKVHGARTGRVAGGADATGEMDKVDSRGAYNPLNIPEDYRRMYVAPIGRVFAYADWKGQESHAVAWYAQDATYLAQLEEERRGGPSVHARRAHLLWGVDPQDAKRVTMSMAGHEQSVYKAAKIAGHAWTYNLIPHNMLMYQLGCDIREAARIDDLLRSELGATYEWKWRTVREVCGVWEEYDIGRSKIPRARCVERGRGWLANPFGWMLEFPGVGEVRTHPVTGKRVALPVQANEVLAFLPQSTGASVWARAALELGWSWHPEVAARLGAGGWQWVMDHADELVMDEEKMPVVAGSYDSVMLVVEDTPRGAGEGVALLRRVMEQPWEAMGGYCFPVSTSVGYTMGEATAANPRGLGSVEIAA